MSSEIQEPESQSGPSTDIDRALDAMRHQCVDLWGIPLFGGSFLSAGTDPSTVYRAARTDVTDTGTAYRVVVEVPGIPKDKIDIRVRGTSVEIRGESSQEKEESGTEFVHRERAYAGYFRSLELPEPVVATEAKAKVENGLLELELPKQHPTPSPAEVKVAVA